MGMLGEFREFIARGSVVDLAVGVVIGAAFGKIVTAFVDGIVMPIVGVALGGVSVSDWKWVLKPETIDAAGKKVAEVAVRYGSFIQTLIDFVIIAFVIFLLLRPTTACVARPMKRRGTAGGSASSAEIRDSSNDSHHAPRRAARDQLVRSLRGAA
jgi:large conductance mechanosensitive channel